MFNDQHLGVNKLADCFNRMLDGIFPNCFKIDIKVIFLFEDLNQFKEHKGITPKVGDDL